MCIALSSGFVLNSLLSGCKTPLGVIKTKSDNDVVTVPLTEFEKGDYKLVRVSNYDYDLAIQKKPDGTFDTLVLECTHAGQPVTKTGNTYYCTLHGSVFSHEGKVMKGPAERDLRKLASTVSKDVLTIKLR